MEAPVTLGIVPESGEFDTSIGGCEVPVGFGVVGIAVVSSSHDAGLAQTLDGETKDRAHKSARIGTCCAMPGKWADPAQDFCVPVAIMRNKS
jgi:hypothetical protein